MPACQYLSRFYGHQSTDCDVQNLCMAEIIAGSAFLVFHNNCFHNTAAAADRMSLSAILRVASFATSCSLLLRSGFRAQPAKHFSARMLPSAFSFRFPVPTALWGAAQVGEAVQLLCPRRRRLAASFAKHIEAVALCWYWRGWAARHLPAADCSSRSRSDAGTGSHSCQRKTGAAGGCKCAAAD